MDGKPLQGVFSEIEHQSKCKFVYDANSLDITAPITMHVKKESLYNILIELSEKMNLDFKSWDSKFLYSGSACANFSAVSACLQGSHL